MLWKVRISQGSLLCKLALRSAVGECEMWLGVHRRGDPEGSSVMGVRRARENPTDGRIAASSPEPVSYDSVVFVCPQALQLHVGPQG